MAAATIFCKQIFSSKLQPFININQQLGPFGLICKYLVKYVFIIEKGENATLSSKPKQSQRQHNSKIVFIFTLIEG